MSSNNSKSPDRVSLSEEEDHDDGDQIKIKKCADCGTSKTPLWRSGPAGPKV